jgi:hypothetical protein
MEFTVLNFPRGFWSSLGQRPHFLRFLGFNQPLSFLSHLHQPSFESFAMLVYEAQPAILTTKACHKALYSWNSLTHSFGSDLEYPLAE